MTFYTRNMTTLTSQEKDTESKKPYRPLTRAEIDLLTSQYCFCPDWSKVSVREGTDLRSIRFCRFLGTVKIGILDSASEREEGIYNAVIRDCAIGDHVFISGVAGRLEGLVIDDDVRIENVGRIIAEPGADFGVGTTVSVLDETGSRPVCIFPGLTAQMAALMAHHPRWTEDSFIPLIDEMRQNMSETPTIGKGAEILDTRFIFDVKIGPGVRVFGASYLKNGTILSNAHSGHSLTFVGNDVDAEDFIVEDGYVDAGTLLRRCYVGQGVELLKRFTAHDSLFFANCSLENGEACAILAGPYTVSMHKSSLLIGGEYSFFNAGSGTNSSNHKYKLGPVHWGIMQRGVKTASDSYIMWGGHIGAFSLLMGAHKSHPDTSDFPFSYLFGRPDGTTLVAPGLMLKSCGLMRDELKWPKRDRRIKGRVPLHDHVHFEVLNPITVGEMIRGLGVLKELAGQTPDSNGLVTHKGVFIKASAIGRGIEFYTLGIAKYIYGKLKEEQTVSEPKHKEPTVWKDLGGQIVPASVIEEALHAETLEEIRRIIDQAYEQFPAIEREWISQILSPDLKDVISRTENAAARLDALVDKDRKEYLASLSAQNSAYTL